MKKILLWVMLLMLVPGMGAAAQEETAGTESAAGLWYMAEVVDGDRRINTPESGVYILMELAENGKAVFRSMGSGRVEQTMEGVWSHKGENVTISVGGGQMQAVLTEDCMQITETDGVVEYMYRLDPQALTDTRGRWIVQGGDFGAGYETSENRSVLVCMENCTARMWEFDSGDNLIGVIYGNWLRIEDTVYVTIGADTVWGAIEGENLCLAHPERGSLTLMRGEDAVVTTEDILGEWVLEGAIMDKEYIPAASRKAEGNMILHEDGTISGTLASNGEKDGEAAGSWCWVDQQLGITLDGTQVLCTLMEGRMVAHIDVGAEMVFAPGEGK